MDIYKNIIASSSCVALSVAIFNPLDCLRIRWQVSKNSNFNNYLNNIIKNEGIINGLWKPGFSSNVIASGISRGIGIGLYPYIRNKISTKKTKMSIFSAGLISGALGYGISNPLWIIKTRVQADKEIYKYNYKSTFKAFKSIFINSGFKGLYSGITILALRGSLMNSGNTLGYDGTKLLLKYKINEGPTLHIISSINAAFLSATFATPSDYLLTMYQTGNKGKIQNCFKGWLPMFLRICPIYCLYLPLYEYTRVILELGYL